MKKYFQNGFIVFPCGKSFVVYNLRKEFKEGHSHLRSFKACKDAINFVTHKQIPKRCSFYYLRTLQRITNDGEYAKELEDLIKVRKQKGKKQSYRNKPVFIR